MKILRNTRNGRICLELSKELTFVGNGWTFFKALEQEVPFFISELSTHKRKMSLE